MLIHKTGNLFDSDAGMIGHGCNAVGAMASGIAVEFKNRFPEMHRRYQELCWQPGAFDRLPGRVMLWKEEENLVIANMFSQNNPGANASYAWTISALNDALIYAEIMGIDTLAIPRIACGIGGLDWHHMNELLEILSREHTVNIEVWSL